MQIIHPHAAGIDIGASHIFVSPPNKEVVKFETFTQGFYKASTYLKDHGVTSVAMEATGSYWYTLYDILIETGFDVWLVDGRETRQVPGRKTDVKDCQWIQQLHSVGLLKRCFVAEGDIKSLRSFQRLREDHIQRAATHVNQMQKVLIEMNIRLPQVLSEIKGASGMAVIEAILKGERDPHTLLSLCHSSVIANKSEQILKALEGFYTPHGLFALQQAYEGYEFYNQQIAACDKELEKALNQINQNTPTLKKKTEKWYGAINQI